MSLGPLHPHSHTEPSLDSVLLFLCPGPVRSLLEEPLILSDYEVSPRGSTFQAMVSVMAVKIQLSSPSGVLRSFSRPGILDKMAFALVPPWLPRQADKESLSLRLWLGGPPRVPNIPIVPTCSLQGDKTHPQQLLPLPLHEDMLTVFPLPLYVWSEHSWQHIATQLHTCSTSQLGSKTSRAVKGSTPFAVFLHGCLWVPLLRGVEEERSTLYSL